MGCPAQPVPAMCQLGNLWTTSVKAAPGSAMPLGATSCYLAEADVSRRSVLCGSGALGTSRLSKKLPVPSSTPVTSNSCASLTQGCSGENQALLVLTC